MRSCALYCAFEHFGNTGENIKRMQDTKESPKLSVIEISSCEVRLTVFCKGGSDTAVSLEAQQLLPQMP